MFFFSYILLPDYHWGKKNRLLYQGLRYTGFVTSKFTVYKSNHYDANLLYSNCQQVALKQDRMHFGFCPKQGNKLQFVLLNRGCILGLFFILNRVRVSNPQWRSPIPKYWWSTPPDLNSYLAPCCCNLPNCFFNGKVKKTLSALKGGSISNVNLNH